MMAQKLERRIEPLPEEITSANAKLVYLYIDAAGPATVEDLNRTLSMKKIGILSVLNSLERRGLVEEFPDGYVTTER